MARFPDGHIRIIGQGLSRIRIEKFISESPYMRAEIEILKEKTRMGEKAKAIVRNVKSIFAKIVDASESYPEERPASQISLRHTSI